MPSPPDVWLWQRELGETALMFRFQMTETSNPKHGCVVAVHASVHCQPVGMLTDDAPDSSPLLLNSHFQTSTALPHLPLLHRTWGKITETHSQIIHRAPLLNMWLTHWESLWEIRLKNELFIRTWNAGPIGGGESGRIYLQYTPNNITSLIMTLPTVVIHFYNTHKCSPLYSDIEILQKITW